jgi:hypothetical protein
VPFRHFILKAFPYNALLRVIRRKTFSIHIRFRIIGRRDIDGRYSAYLFLGGTHKAEPRCSLEATAVSLLSKEYQFAMQRLFVYGTLAPGRANHEVLKGIPGSWEAATLRVTLLQEGRGAAMVCPGVVPTEFGDEVEGFVFSSAHLASH